MTPPQVNLRHFCALDDIADTGRLSDAADRLSLTQSALTQALRRLEDAAGCALFERTGFGVTETASGRLLVRRARRSIHLFAKAEHEIGVPVGGRPLHRHVSASQLRALVAVVETGGYSTAARRLRISQPSVHRAVKETVAAIGIDLVLRGTRGIEPTDAARVLARHAELVFAELRQGFEDVREKRGVTDSRIAIGSLPLARSEFLPTAITRLLSKHPDARVSILDGPYVEQLHALRYSQVDWLIGALRDPVPTPDVRQQHLFEQPLAVVVRPGHPLLSTKSPSVAALAELDWIAPRQLAPARRFFDDFFSGKGVETPTRIIECSSLIATRGLLLQSDRAALLSPLQVRADVAAGELAVLIEAVPDSSRAIGVTTRENWEPTRMQAEFTQILRELAADVASGLPAL
ncbi:MAG: LysR family transcriptional regulator [Pseudomonadota bacterium]